MNKRGQTIILLAWFLLIWAVISIGFSLYQFAGAKEVCESNEGDVSVEKGFWGVKAYNCIINNSKHEMVEIVGDGFKIIKLDASRGLDA